uniref:uncharacterized protein LOC129133146 n=1 Tax=Agelaius phoeniceus TaxID=39638 RepID=UPI0023EDB90A|nr:uncharacterized protein LOC129133146 [Agelaius phoeniceus]
MLPGGTWGSAQVRSLGTLPVPRQGCAGPPSSLRGRASLPGRAAPADRPPLTLRPGGEAASTKRGLENTSVIDIGHHARLRQSRGTQLASDSRCLQKNFENTYSAKLHFLRNLTAAFSTEETPDSFWRQKDVPSDSRRRSLPVFPRRAQTQPGFAAAAAFARRDRGPSAEPGPAATGEGPPPARSSAAPESQAGTNLACKRGISRPLSARPVPHARAGSAPGVGTQLGTRGCAWRPSPITHCPPPTTQPPSPSTHRPSPIAQPPAPITQPPAPIARRPAPSAQHPSPITQHPSPIAHLPSPITQRPSPITQRPSPISHHPSPSAQRPSPIAQRPAPIAQCPLPSAQRPSPSAHCPAPIAHRPAPIAQHPSPIAQRPSPSAQCPSPIARAVGPLCCPLEAGGEEVLFHF